MQCSDADRLPQGDVSLSAEDKPPEPASYKVMSTSSQTANGSLDLEPDGELAYEGDQEESEHHGFLEGHTALKFLLAGGVAGAGASSLFLHQVLTIDSAFTVSRTCTAPFDRLKIFLITRPPELGGPTVAGTGSKAVGVKVISGAIARIYAEGGLLAFWVGNGLSVAKIFPESAIKFYSYETSVSFILSRCVH